MSRILIRQLKLRGRWLMAGCVFSAAALLGIVFTRFNFSHQVSPSLAQFQKSWGVNQPSDPLTDISPQIIGHRGSGLPTTGGYVGNTRNAIRAAVDAGVDWIEVDVRKSRDDVLMVFHDEDLSRVTGLEEQFAALDRDRIQGLNVNVDPVETIPTLEEVLQEFSAHEIRFVLDIKVNSIKDQLLPLVQRYLSRDRIILFGTHQILQEYSKEDYTLGYTALWSELGNRYQFLWSHEFLLERCRNLECDYLILPSIFLNQSLIEEAKSQSLDVWAYDVDGNDWKDVTRRGVTGLIVDQPASARHEFSHR